MPPEPLQTVARASRRRGPGAIRLSAVADTSRRLPYRTLGAGFAQQTDVQVTRKVEKTETCLLGRKDECPTF